MFHPTYTISNTIVNKLTEIAAIRSMVDRSRLLPQREVFLRRAAAIKIAHSSTSIEGNLLNEYQVTAVAQGKRIQADADQVKEVQNYLAALRHIDKLAESNNTITLKDILSIHKLITDGLVDEGKTGTFRKGPVYIVNILPTKQEKVAYTPPPADQILPLTEDLLHWLSDQSDIHPIVRAGLFHYQFETIHPFTDGNGRTGRLLTLLHLYKSGWSFRKIIVLEDYYNSHRKAYYEALQTGATYKARQNANLNKWLEYFVDGFAEEARKVSDHVVNLSAVQHIHATRTMLDRDELKIVDFVVTVGQITSADAVDILHVPKRTAQAKLKKLEDVRVLKKVGAGPMTYYIIQKENT